jgi:arylsulfatase
VHLDGFNLLPFLEGQVEQNPRPGFLYWSDDGDLLALRYGNWKFHFMEQRGHGIHAWEEPFVRTRVPLYFNLRSNPFEVDAEDANLFFNKEKVDRLFLILPAVGLVSQYLKTFEEFPPRQRPASFSVDQALEQARDREQQLHEAATRG